MRIGLSPSIDYPGYSTGEQELHAYILAKGNLQASDLFLVIHYL